MARMKMRKQVVIGMLVILASLLMICNFSMAQTATVNTDTLKLRKEASTDSTILELLNQGQKLEILEKSGDWAKVKVNGMTGYVHMDYIKLQEETNTTNTQTQNSVNEVVLAENNEIQNTVVENVIVPQEKDTTTEEPQTTVKEEQTYQMREETLRSDVEVRILPLINATKMDRLKKETKVMVVDEVSGWLYIQTGEVSGWIRKSALEEVTGQPTTPNQGEEKPTTVTTENPTEPVETSNEETPIQEKAMYVNSPSVYVRKGPSTKEEIVDSLILNAQVIVTAEVEDWYKVTVDNKTGYIAKRLLSNTKQETTSRGAEERENEAEETATTAAPVASSKGEEIANVAKQYLGCKYVYGGSGPSTFDCSGFTMYVYKQFGINLSHSARAQSKNGSYVAKEDLQPGDLVFFKDYETMDGIGHCGIYIGEGNFIHASSGTGYCVKISTLLSGSYKTRYETARRLI